MAPAAIIPEITDYVQPKKDNLNLPGPTRARLEEAGIDLSQGYPVRSHTSAVLLFHSNELRSTGQPARCTSRMSTPSVTKTENTSTLARART